ncbi:unnamed protein product [Penicillium olsonii]|uniref:Uncharacterized protein n=1 Tax=Penicillium olsonii TaxID=99116 RepID=A0A9W4MPU2_PENOL|nr:unnamed protein product [Penicillium olsonii]CAG8149474.1 unnamed protein product [Penicillium olsonii]
MEETIAELRRQLREVRQARDGERQARDEAQRHVQPNTLFAFLDRCHNSLSQAIRVERDATLTTQGDATNPVNRLYPKRIVPWLDFPNVQEQVWRKLNRSSAFTSHPLFPSNHQLDFFVRIHQNQQIDSEASLRNFERDTVDNFVEMAIEALRDNECLRHELKIQGRVTFYDRADPSETLLESSLEQMDIQDSRKPQRYVNTGHDGGNRKGRGTAQRQKGAGTARRHNRRADQSCMYLIANKRLKPVYVVEYKAPHKVTIPQLVAGLHHIDLARDVID